MTIQVTAAQDAPWVVIAGDWFVDENWFIAPHHSSSSSHVGREHFRIVSEANDTVKDLCGGGLVARVLYELRKYRFDCDHLCLSDIRKKKPNISDEDVSSKPKEFALCGTGIWHTGDTDILKHFVHVNCNPIREANKASFSMNTRTCEDEVDMELANIRSEGSEAATVRCIRTFTKISGKLIQTSRVDWEPAPSTSSRTVAGQPFEELTDILGRDKRAISAIIIDDHLKGAVTVDLINILKNRAGSAKWFVRTKNSSVSNMSTWPQWMRSIEVPLELLVIGPETSCRDYALNGLLAGPGRIAAHCFDLLETLMRREKGKAEPTGANNVVLTSDKLEAVGLFGESDLVIADPCQDHVDGHQKINWTTSLFAGLCYEIISGGNSDFQTILMNAANQAYSRSGIMENALYARRLLTVNQPTTSNWGSVQGEWHQSKAGLGLVELNNPDERCLQIWRAASDLPGYIACVDEKREAIRRIWRAVRRFSAAKRPRGSVSVLLEADPGIGKTHLARTLAKQIDCTFISHDIAQMIHRDELLDLFDMVAAAQAEQADKPVFIFVDEINALLDDSPVYGAFLSPLEAGNYLRRGSRFQLQPCIWMFAGTPSTESAKQPEDAREKRKDFESRLTMIERIDYRSMCEKAGEGTRVADQARLEQSYMGALMINQSFTDVHLVDQDVLALFQALPPEMALARLVRRLASSLENVQYGRVHKGNCTSQEWSQAIGTYIPAYERDQWKKVDLASIQYVKIDPKM